MLMLKDMWYPVRYKISHKNFEKVSLVRIKCPVCIIMTIHAIFKNIMRQRGYSIDIYVANVLPRIVRSVTRIAKQKIINSGHTR